MSSSSNQPVYCTNCRHFKPLYEATLKGCPVNPEPCQRCFPFDAEDSRPHVERPYYEDDVIRPLK